MYGLKSVFSRKANAPLEVILIMVILFCFSLAVTLAYPAFTAIKETIDEDPNMSAEAKERTNTLYGKYPLIFDYGFLAILFLLWGATLLSAFFVDSHPGFFIIFVLALIVIFWVGAELGNAHYDIVSQDDFQSIKDQTPIINYVMGHFFEILVFIGFTIAVAMVMKVVV